MKKEIKSRATVHTSREKEREPQSKRPKERRREGKNSKTTYDNCTQVCKHLTMEKKLVSRIGRPDETRD